MKKKIEKNFTDLNRNCFPVEKNREAKCDEGKRVRIKIRDSHTGQKRPRRLEFQPYKMRRILETGGGDSCTTQWTHLIPPNGSLKNAYDGKFYVGVFYHNNKKQKFKTPPSFPFDQPPI